jgi:hypothetical protein
VVLTMRPRWAVVMGWTKAFLIAWRPMNWLQPAISAAVVVQRVRRSNNAPRLAISSLPIKARRTTAGLGPMGENRIDHLKTNADFARDSIRTSNEVQPRLDARLHNLLRMSLRPPPKADIQAMSAYDPYGSWPRK